MKSVEDNLAIRNFTSPDGTLSFELGRDKQRRSQQTHITTFIGVNGSGKSRLLGEIATAFKSGRETFAHATGNGELEELTAISNLVADRFPFTSSARAGYRYLGLRQATNALFLGSVENSLSRSLFELLATTNPHAELSPIFDMVGVESPTLSLRLRDRRPFRPSTTSAKVSDPVSFRWLRDDHDLPGIADLYVELLESFRPPTGKSVDFRHPLRSPSVIADFSTRLMETATKYDVPFWIASEMLSKVTGVQIAVDFAERTHYRRKSGDYLSTGQSSFISLFARILLAATRHSVILIDEPEVGLHPEWQAELVPLIRRILADKGPSQILIATHSPYLVGDSDQVLVAGQNGKFQPLPFPHEGLSIDETLYYTFGSRLIGSRFIERDLNLLLHWLSTNPRPMPGDEVRSAAWALNRIESGKSPLLRSVLSEFREAVSSIDLERMGGK